MQEIPDTGGGLSGFIARGLWYVYQYFPFEETWDWLLLIVFFAVLARCIMIPVWWRLVKLPGQSSDDREGLLAIVILGDLFWPWLVIWLLNTDAGRTFLEGRAGPPLDAAQWLYRASLVYHAVAFFVGAGLIDDNDMDSFRSNTGGLVAAHSAVAFVAHLYWYWSVASLVVLLVFGVTAVITSTIVALIDHYAGS